MTIDGYRASTDPIMGPATYGTFAGLFIGTIGMLAALAGFRG